MQAQRIQKSATISLNAPIDLVFPLFGPIREKDWADGWDPEIVFLKDPLVEKHMVFKTRSTEVFTWVIVNYEPGNFMIEYLVTASERLWFITVQCSDSGTKTSATITYSYTGFNPEANKKNYEAITAMFSSNLEDWQDAINQYLLTNNQ